MRKDEVMLFLAVVLMASSAQAGGCPAGRGGGGGGSGVGNGGDVFSHYLETVRVALRQSVERLESVSSETDALCEGMPEIDSTQASECRDFIRATMDQVRLMNSGEAPVPFEISDDPLCVTDPYGNPLEVDAETQLDSTSPVIFSYARTKSDSPALLLRLMAHEFGHKSLFQGAHVTDNDPIGHYPTGRLFLDEVGEAISRYAQANSLVGTSFKIIDHFFCRTFDLASGKPLNAALVDGYRSVLGSGGADRYDAGFGDDPLSGRYIQYLNEPNLPYLTVRIRNHEEQGCRADGAATRWSRMQVVRVDPTTSGTSPKESLVAERILDQDSITCDGQIEKVAVAADGFRFECDYSGYTAVGN